MRFIVCAATDKGRWKETNQDVIILHSAEAGSIPVCMGVLCDGMGGLSHGELAASTVALSFSDWFKRELPRTLREGTGNLFSIWNAELSMLNKRIQRYGQRYGFQMGTTMTLFLAIDRQYYIAHIGDSRCYQIGRSIEQLTEDHSVVGQEVRCGRLTEEEAERDPRRSILLQCIGASDVVRPQFLTGAVSIGETFLLCSDGFRHTLTPEEIWLACYQEGRADRREMEEALRRMVGCAMERGERDNVTAALIRCVEG